MKEFEVAGGSVIGRDHVNKSQNNQDAWTWYQDSEKDITAAVVCDGCGSGKHSEVGSQLGVRFLMNAIRYACEESHTDVLEHVPQSFFGQVKADLLDSLRDVLSPLQMGNSKAMLVEDYLLFTLVGVIITPATTVVFSMGDGMFAVGHKGKEVIEKIHPEAGNAPTYVAYNITGTSLNLQPGALDFQIRFQAPTEEVDWIIVGSDGLEDIQDNQTRMLPGSENEFIGNVTQFSRPEFFQNPDNIRRRLSLINKSGQKVDWENRRITKYHGVLRDDTTLAVLRRKPETKVLVLTDEDVSAPFHDPLVVPLEDMLPAAFSPETQQKITQHSKTVFRRGDLQITLADRSNPGPYQVEGHPNV